jgi:hypothetical protein
MTSDSDFSYYYVKFPEYDYQASVPVTENRPIFNVWHSMTPVVLASSEDRNL